MPPEAALELDEVADWVRLEALVKFIGRQQKRLLPGESRGD